MATADQTADNLINSPDPLHPANLIPSLCRQFYTLGWVTGTGGGVSIATPTHEFLAPSGVQKERLAPQDLFVAVRNPNGSITANCGTTPDDSTADDTHQPVAAGDVTRGSVYVRTPRGLKPSACTPLFRAAFARGAGACVHTHSAWAVLVTLLLERRGGPSAAAARVFEIEELEQIKGIGRGRGKRGNLGYYDRLRVPVIENTAREEDLTVSLEAAMDEFPDTYAVLVRRHGVYVWGDDWEKAKTMCESFDYIFQLAVEMAKLGIPWTKEEHK